MLLAGGDVTTFNQITKLSCNNYLVVLEDFIKRNKKKNG